MDMKSRHEYSALQNVYALHSESIAILRAGKAAVQRCRKNGWIVNDPMTGRLMLTNEGDRVFRKLAQQHIDEVKSYTGKGKR